MRLTSHQVQLAKTTIDRVLQAPNRVWLFGSRADDAQSGGDIDLLVEMDVQIDDRASTTCRLYGALIMALGDRKIDVLLKDARPTDAPVFEIAKRTGVLL